MTIRGSVWVPIGPSPIMQAGRQDNGLTSAIAVNPNNPNLVYQGTAGGGIWRSRDGGATWRPIFDRQVALAIGNPSALTIDPNDTSVVYAGTSGRVAMDGPAGLFKSIDGGASFIRLGSGYPAGNIGNVSRFFTDSINVVIVDPADSQTIYLASTTGVYRSTDGGLNWTIGAGSNGDVRTLALDASSAAAARLLYVGISSRGAFQSTDGGQNWTQILGSTTPAVATAVGGGGFGKVLIALAPATSPPAAGGIQVLYVSLQGTGGAPDPVGLFISADQGGTWTAQAAAGIPGNTQGGYSFHMAVDPASPGDGANDIIYLGAVGQARSTDSGANFTPLSGIHADTHAWAFALRPAGTPTTVFCGTDGGLYRSTDGGTTWAALNAGGLQTTLFYNMAVKPDATASVTLGAAQDNGAQTTSGAIAPAWRSPQGGDGWDVEFDGTTAARAYATSGFWPAPCTRVFASTADGTDFPPTVPSALDITPWGTTTDQGCYLASIATDPSAAGTVYVGGSQNVWQSRDGGTTWQIIGAVPFARASVAPSNGNNVVVAAGNQVSVSTNALTTPAANVTFTNITRNLPSRSVLRAAFDPNDPSVIYATLGGFNDSAPGQSGHVFRTTIGGTAWTDISPELDAPVGALALDGTDTPTTIYIGTDLGVLRSVNGGATWYVLDDIHFPRAPVTDLVIGRGSGILRAATYGRGVFEFAQANGPVIAVNLENGFEFRTSGEESIRLTLQVFNVGTADLVIHSLQRLNGSQEFEVDPFPATPLVIADGSEVDFTVRYTPTPGAAGVATIRIRSSDPGAPELDLVATAVPLPEQRVTEGLIALYTFAAGSGKVVADVSGAGAALDLTISDPDKVDWLPGGGLAIRGDTLIASAGPATKIIDACKTSGELTIESWVEPATTTQSGPARIVTLSRDPLHRNFTLGEGLWGSQPTDVYDVRLRTTATDANGRPSTTSAPGSVRTVLSHVVFTRAADGTTTIYLDGESVRTGKVGGTFANWDAGYRLALANELATQRPWHGDYRLVALFHRALSAAEVRRNFSVGRDRWQGASV